MDPISISLVYPVNPKRLKVFSPKIGHFRVEVNSSHAAIDSMILIRIYHIVKFLVVLDKLLCKAHTILNMHVIISSPVN